MPEKKTDDFIIAIGVTGHRAIAAKALPALESGLMGIFRDLLECFPASGVTLMTCLAAGADQMAARVALRLGISVSVLLPLTETEYRKDFSDEQWTSFIELRNRAARVQVIGQARAEGNEDSRQVQYAAANAALVRTCRLLIALWDGRKARSMGGTGEAVEYALRGVPPRFLIDRAGTVCPVIQLPTPREGQAATLDDPLEPRIWMPGDAGIAFGKDFTAKSPESVMVLARALAAAMERGA